MDTITDAILDWVRDTIPLSWAHALLGEHCYNVLLRDAQVWDAECSAHLLSRVLSCGILLGGLVLKLPQIVVVLRSKSGRGISKTSILMETFAFFVALAYNVRHAHPFTTYGETLFIAVQNVFLVAAMLCFDAGRVGALGAALVTGGAVGVLYYLTWVLAPEALAYLQTIQLALIVASKTPQIVANHWNRGTGQLSALTTLLALAGAVARIFTTLQEVHDDTVLRNTCLSAVLNGILVAQLVYYNCCRSACGTSRGAGGARVAKKGPAAAAASKGGDTPSKKANGASTGSLASGGASSTKPLAPFRRGSGLPPLGKSPVLPPSKKGA